MDYSYQTQNLNLSYDEAVRALKDKFPNNKINRGGINNLSAEVSNDIKNSIDKLNIPCENLNIDEEEYNNYIAASEYKTRYSSYYSDNFPEKSLEHYIAYKLLGLLNDSVFVDIASEHSPVSEIFHRLTGCTCYSQDIMYKKGIHENKIGSNADNLPVTDEFFDAATATCSLEHFENRSDINFITEMQRTLKPGGKLIVAPLYLYTCHSCQTDPLHALAGNVTFDKNAEIFCAESWGNRHGRFYSVTTLYERLIRPNPSIQFKMLTLQNPKDIDSSIYCKYILQGTKI